MERTTITRADLAETVFRKVGLSRTESADLVEMVLDEICTAIERGNNVMLSNFGTFQVRNKEERIGRNPKTGEEAKISPRRVISFKASSNLKDRVFSAHHQADDCRGSYPGVNLTPSPLRVPIGRLRAARLDIGDSRRLLVAGLV